MEQSDNLFFGQIALREGLLTLEELQEALAFQEQDETGTPLGKVLVQLGYLSQAQVEQALKLQAERLRQRDVFTLRKVEDVVFGHVAVKQGFVRTQEVHRALRKQARLAEEGNFVRIGELLVEQGVLTHDQVRQILSHQRKTILICKKCYTKYNIRGFAPEKRFRCKKCREVLTVPKELDSAGAEDPDSLPGVESEAELPPVRVPAGVDQQTALRDDMISLFDSLPPLPVPAEQEVVAAFPVDPLQEGKGLFPTAESLVTQLTAILSKATDETRA